MKYLIYDAMTLIEYDQGDMIDAKDTSELRAKLQVLRDLPVSNPARIFCGARGDTIEECRASAIQNADQIKERLDYIASLPEVTGHEMTQQEWDDCMVGLNAAQRGEAANLAAHSWATAPHPDGILLIGGRDGRKPQGAILLTRDGNRTWVYDKQLPKICGTCKWSDGYSSPERGYKMCALSTKDDRYEIRKTRPTQTCTGYKKWKPKKK